jgi:hypothetical protein
MKNKPLQKAEFVKNITDRYEEIGELYKVGSDFYVVKWYRDDFGRKPCKNNTLFTEVWQSDERGKVECGRVLTYEWQRWHSGKSIMAQFLKSRACPSPAEILAQNRDDLLERMSESGNAHTTDYPYGLMMEAEEEIKRLRAEADANNNAFRKGTLQ